MIDNDLIRETKKKEVLSLRVRGYDVDDIAITCKMDPKKVKEILKNTIEELRRDKKEEAEEYMRIIEKRKEMMVKTLMPEIQSGDVKSILAWVKIEENYQKLAGYVGKDVELNITSDVPIKYYGIISPDDLPPPKEKNDR